MKNASHSSLLNRKVIFTITVLGIMSLAMLIITFQEGFPFKPLVFLSLALLFVTFSFDTIFLLLVFFIVFQANMNISFGRFVIQPLFLMIPFLFLKTIFDSFLEDRKVFFKSSVNFFLMFIIVAFAISSVKCYYTLGRATFTKSIVFQFKFLMVTFLFYIITYYSRKKNNVYRMMKVLIGLLLMLSLSGIIEYVGIKLGVEDLVRSLFRLFGRAETYSLFADKRKLLRISGLVGSPENFASILSFLLLPLIGFRFYSTNYRRIIDISAVFCIISIVLSGTRSALFALAIYLIVFLLIESGPKIKMKFLLFSIIMVILGYPLSKTLRQRFLVLSSSDTYQVVMRKQFHNIAYDLFTREKLFGVGWGTFNANYRKNISNYPVLYESRHYFRDGINRARSVYLQFLHDLGIFGLTIFLTFWISCIIVSLKVSLQSKDIILKYLGIGFLSNLIIWTILGYSGSGFFLIIGGSTVLPAFFWIYYGLVYSIYHHDLSHIPLENSC